MQNGQFHYGAYGPPPPSFGAPQPPRAGAEGGGGGDGWRQPWETSSRNHPNLYGFRNPNPYENTAFAHPSQPYFPASFISNVANYPPPQPQPRASPTRQTGQPFRRFLENNLNSFASPVHRGRDVFSRLSASSPSQPPQNPPAHHLPPTQSSSMTPISSGAKGSVFERLQSVSAAGDTMDWEPIPSSENNVFSRLQAVPSDSVDDANSISNKDSTTSGSVFSRLHQISTDTAPLASQRSVETDVFARLETLPPSEVSDVRQLIPVSSNTENADIFSRITSDTDTAITSSSSASTVHRTSLTASNQGSTVLSRLARSASAEVDPIAPISSPPQKTTVFSRLQSTPPTNALPSSASVGVDPIAPQLTVSIQKPTIFSRLQSTPPTNDSPSDASAIPGKPSVFARLQETIGTTQDQVTSTSVFDRLATNNAPSSRQTDSTTSGEHAATGGVDSVFSRIQPSSSSGLVAGPSTADTRVSTAIEGARKTDSTVPSATPSVPVTSASGEKKSLPSADLITSVGQQAEAVIPSGTTITSGAPSSVNSSTKTSGVPVSKTPAAVLSKQDAVVVASTPVAPAGPLTSAAATLQQNAPGKQDAAFVDKLERVVSSPVTGLVSSTSLTVQSSIIPASAPGSVDINSKTTTASSAIPGKECNRAESKTVSSENVSLSVVSSKTSAGTRSDSARRRDSARSRRSYSREPRSRSRSRDRRTRSRSRGRRSRSRGRRSRSRSRDRKRRRSRSRSRSRDRERRRSRSRERRESKDTNEDRRHSSPRRSSSNHSPPPKRNLPDRPLSRPSSRQSKDSSSASELTKPNRSTSSTSSSVTDKRVGNTTDHSVVVQSAVADKPPVALRVASLEQANDPAVSSATERNTVVEASDESSVSVKPLSSTTSQVSQTRSDSTLHQSTPVPKPRVPMIQGAASMRSVFAEKTNPVQPSTTSAPCSVSSTSTELFQSRDAALSRALDFKHEETSETSETDRKNDHEVLLSDITPTVASGLQSTGVSSSPASQQIMGVMSTATNSPNLQSHQVSEQIKRTGSSAGLVAVTPTKKARIPTSTAQSALERTPDSAPRQHSLVSGADFLSDTDQVSPITKDSSPAPSRALCVVSVPVNDPHIMQMRSSTAVETYFCNLCAVTFSNATAHVESAAHQALAANICKPAMKAMLRQPYDYSRSMRGDVERSSDYDEVADALEIAAANLRPDTQSEAQKELITLRNRIFNILRQGVLAGSIPKYALIRPVGPMVKGTQLAGRVQAVLGVVPASPSATTIEQTVGYVGEQLHAEEPDAQYAVSHDTVKFTVRDEATGSSVSVVMCIGKTPTEANELRESDLLRCKRFYAALVCSTWFVITTKQFQDLPVLQDVIRLLAKLRSRDSSLALVPLEAWEVLAVHVIRVSATPTLAKSLRGIFSLVASGIFLSGGMTLHYPHDRGMPAEDIGAHLTEEQRRIITTAGQHVLHQMLAGDHSWLRMLDV